MPENSATVAFPAKFPVYACIYTTKIGKIEEERRSSAAKGYIYKVERESFAARDYAPLSLLNGIALRNGLTIDLHAACTAAESLSCLPRAESGANFA